MLRSLLITAPRNVVISGGINTITQITELLSKEKITWQKLRVSHAFHSPLMEPILNRFEGIAKNIEYASPTIPIISNLTGAWIDKDHPIDHGYLKDQIRDPVNFERGILTLAESGYTHYLEIGARPTLLPMAKRCYPKEHAKNIQWLSSMNPNANNWAILNESICRLYRTGFSIDWNEYYCYLNYCKVPLPTYSFDRERYWIDIDQNKNQQKTISPSNTWNVVVKKALRESETSFQRQGLKDFDQFLNVLNETSFQFQYQAFQSLGIFEKAKSSVEVNSLFDRFGILSRHRQLIQRWLTTFQNEGLIRLNNGFMEITGKRIHNDNENGKDILLKFGLPKNMQVFFDYVNQFGKVLPEILTGKYNPLEILFPKGSFSMSEKMYQKSALGCYFNGILSAMVKAILANQTQNSKVRILEIGAGTGSTSSYLLPLCSAASTEYVFTDLGDLFLQRAKKRFADFPFIEYQHLNIENPPQKQGFDCFSFDIIIAANVLHATKDLCQTLSHIRSLVVPHGTLMIWEVTEHPQWFDTTISLIEGWNRYENDRLRNNHPLLTVGQWKDALEANGFESIHRIPDEKSDSNLLGQHIIAAKTKDVTTKLVPFKNENFESKSNLESTLISGRVQSLLYKFEWIQKQHSDPSSRSKPMKNWIIFTDKAGFGTQLASCFEKQGCFCELIGYQANTLSNSIQRIFAKNGAEKFGLIYAWGVDAKTSSAQSSIHLDQQQELCCKGIISILQTLHGRKLLDKISQVWLVTKNSQIVADNSADEEEINIVQSSLWGLGRVIAREYPQIWGGMIDIEEKSFEICNEEVINCLSYPDDEDHIAFRGKNRFVGRLLAKPKPHFQSSTSLKCKQDCSYLITGGLGGMGYELAKCLSARGARRLILMGRTRLPNRLQWEDLDPTSKVGRYVQRIRNLEDLGLCIHIANVDVQNEGQLTEYIRRFRQEKWPPIRGIVHAAGIVEDYPIQKLTSERFDNVGRTKILGSWVLHRLFIDQPLDFFILVSSAATYLAGPGGGNYAAANQFLVALAQLRKQIGIPAICINWGPVEGVGLAKENNRTERLRSQGILPISPSEISEIIDLSLTEDCPSVSFIDINWKHFLGSKSEYNPQGIFHDYFSKTNKSDRPTFEGDSISKTQSKDEPVGVTKQNGNELIRKFLIDNIASLLMLEASRINYSNPLQVMGFDSIMAVQLKSEIELKYDVNIPLEELNQKSIQELSDLISTRETLQVID